MPIYLDTDSQIPVGPVLDADGDPVEGAAVTVKLLRPALPTNTLLWTSSEGTTDAAGMATIDVPDPLLDDEEEEIPLVERELLIERVEIESSTLNTVYETHRRVRRRRA